MSIIHDALKKIQKTGDIAPGNAQKTPSSKAIEPASEIFENPPSLVEILHSPPNQPAKTKSLNWKNPQSIAIMIFAAMIAVGGILYICTQLQSNMPKVRVLAQKSMDKLTNKKPVPEFKTKTPESLKPLARLTIDPSTKNITNPAQSAPITLNIHGIMSNSNGNLVLINDQVYQEGDLVDGAKITKISLDSITLLNNGVEHVISVKD